MKPIAVVFFILLACCLARWACGRGLRCALLAPLLLLACTAAAAEVGNPQSTIPNPQSPILDPANPLAPLAAFLGSALVTKILLWMGTIGAVAKLFAPKLQGFLEDACQAAREGGDPDTQHWLDRVLHNRIYRVFAFLVDYFTRIKLPKALGHLCLCASVVFVSGCTSPVPSNKFSGTIGGVPFVFQGHKQTSVEDVTLEITSISKRGGDADSFATCVTNYSRLHIGKLSSVNDPQVISKSYAGQAAVTREFFDGMNAFASKFAEGAVKGAK